MAVSRLLLGSSLSGQMLLPADAQPVLERFDELQALLALRAPLAADLFAQPVLDRPGSESPTRVSWYGSAIQDPVTLDRLPPAQRATAVAALRERFAALAPLFTDATCAPLLRAALCVSGPQDLLWSGEAPILVNWGMVPEATGDSQEVLARHFNSIFAEFALPGSTPWAPPLLPQPPPPPVEGPNPAVKPALAAASPTPPPTVPPQIFSAVPFVEAGWVGAISAVLGAVAIVLLVSAVSLAAGYYYGWQRLAGMISATAPAPQSALMDADLLRIQQGVNDGLRRRLAELQASAQGNICAVAGGQGASPQSTPIPNGALGSAPGPQTGAEPASPAVAPPAGLEPPPQQQPVQAPPGQPGGAAQHVNLADLLDGSVVMVLGDTILPNGRQGTSMGSGFAVASDRVVTNMHVVKDVTAGHLFVVSRKLGHPVEAEVVAHIGGDVPGEADFAVLKLSQGNLVPLKLSTSIDRLLPVVAVGFPGIITAEGDDFHHMMNGDTDAVPGANFTEGIVSDLQTLHGHQVVIHTAAINHGNSGGPLADRCGRVVGINTFIHPDQENAYSVDYALPTATLLGFLSQNGVPDANDDSPCHPEAALTTTPQGPHTPLQPAAPPPVH